MPIVSSRPIAAAIAVLVPTPSVDETMTGSRMPGGIATADPNPPRPPITSGRRVRRHGRAHQLDRALARGHVHPGAGIGGTLPVIATPSRAGRHRHGDSGARGRRTPSRA